MDRLEIQVLAPAGQWPKLAAAAINDPVLDAIALGPSQVDLVLDVGHLATDGHLSLHLIWFPRAFAELPNHDMLRTDT